MSFARRACPAALAAVVLVTAAPLATAKRLPAPPPGRSLICKSEMSFNHEAATIHVQADGLHVMLAADNKLAHWFKFDYPKDKAHKILRGVPAGGSIEVVFPTAGCQFGKDAGLVFCASPDAPARATVAYPNKKGTPTTATIDLVKPSLTTSRIETTTALDGTTTSWQVQLVWGGTAQSQATAAFTFGPKDTCTAK